MKDRMYAPDKTAQELREDRQRVDRDRRRAERVQLIREIRDRMATIGKEGALVQGQGYPGLYD